MKRFVFALSFLALGGCISTTGPSGGGSSSSSTGGTQTSSAQVTGSSAGGSGGVSGSTSSSGGVVIGALGLTISNAAARACEVLVEDPQNQIVDGPFGSAIEGRSLRRGTRVAAAFAARSDAVLTAADVSLNARTASPDVGALSVVSSRCFDAQGQVLAGASVSFATSH